MSFKPRRLLVVAHNRPHPSSIERIRGLQQAVAEKTTGTEVLYGSPGGINFGPYELVSSFIQSGWVPDAVFPLTTGYTEPIMRALSEKYLRFGKDVHIIMPSISQEILPKQIRKYIFLNIHRMCETALTLLFERIAGNKQGFKIANIPVELVSRQPNSHLII